MKKIKKIIGTISIILALISVIGIFISISLGIWIDTGLSMKLTTQSVINSIIFLIIYAFSLSDNE